MQPPAFSQQPEATSCGHQDVFEVQWRMRQLFQQLDDAQKSQKPNSKKTIEQMRLCYQMSELQDRLQKAKQAGGVNGRKALTAVTAAAGAKRGGAELVQTGDRSRRTEAADSGGVGGKKDQTPRAAQTDRRTEEVASFHQTTAAAAGGQQQGAAASSMPTGAGGSQIHSNSQQLRMSKGVKKAQVRLFKRFEALIEGRIHASAEEKKLQKLRQSLEDDLADCLKMKKRSMQRSRPLSASATVAVPGAARTMKNRGPASRPMSAGPCGPSMVDVDLEPDEPQDDPQAHLRGDTVADLKTQKLLRNTTSQIDSALFKHYQQIQKMKSQVRKQISKNRPVSAVTRSPLDEDVEELQTPPGADGRREPVFGNMENCTQPPLHDNFLQEPGEHADGEPHPHADHGQHGVALTAAGGSLSRSSSAANDSSKSVLPPAIAVHQQKPRPYSAHPKSFQDPPAQGEASSANNSGVAAAGSSLFNTTLTAAGFLSSKKDSGKKRPWTSAGGRGGLTFGPGGVEKGSSNPNSRSASNEKKKMKRPGAANQKWRRAQGFMNTSTAYDSSTTTSTAANGGSTTAAEDSSGASFRLKNFQFPSNNGGAVGEVDVDQFGFPVLRAGTTVSQSYDGSALKAALVREQGALSADVAALPTEHADADGEAPDPAERSALPRGGGRPRAYSSTDVSGAPAGAAAAKSNPRHLAVVDAKTGEVRIASTGGSSALPGNRSSSGKRRKNSAGTRNSSAKSGGGGGTGERGGWSATSEALRRRYGKDCPIGLVPGEQLNAGDSGYASDEAFIMDDADDGYASDTSEKIREATCVKLRKRGWSAARVRSAQPMRAGAAGGIAAAGEQGVGGAEDPDKKRKREEAGAATGTDTAQPVVGAAGAASGSCEGKTKAPRRGDQGAAAGDNASGAAQKYAAEGARDLRGVASSTSELLQHVPSPNRRRRIDPLSNRVPRLDMAATESFKEDVSYPVLTTATTVTTDDEGLQITRLNGRASLSIFSGTKRVQKAAGVDIAPAAGLLPADAVAQSQQDQFSAAATTDPAYRATDEVQLQKQMRHAFSTTNEDVRSCIKQRRLLQRTGSSCSSFGLSFTTGVDINPCSVVASGVGTATLSAASASGELVQPAPRPPIFAKEVLHTLDRHAAEAKLDLETYLLHHDADKQTPFDRVGSVVGGLNAKTLASRVEEKVEQALRTSSGKPAPGSKNKTSSTSSTNNTKTKEEGAEAPRIAVEAAAGDAVSGSLTTGTAGATSTASGSSSGAGTVAAAVAAAPAAPPHQVKLPIKNSPPERENHYAQRERERLRNSKSLPHAPTNHGRSSSSSSSTSSSFLEIPMPEVLLPVPAGNPASIVEDELGGGATHRQHDQEAQQLLVGAGGSAGVLLPERYTRQAAPIRWSQDFPDDPLNQEALAELRRSKEQPQLELDEVDTGSFGGPRGSKNLPPNRSRAGSTASSNGGGSSSFLERERRAPSMSKLPVTNKPRYGYLPPTMWDGLDVVEEISMEVVEVPREKKMRTDPAAQWMLQNLADSYSDPFSRDAVPNNRSVNPEQAGMNKNAARAVVPSSTTSTTSSSGGSLSYGGGRSSSASSSSGSCGSGQSQPRPQQVPKQQEPSREVEKTGKKPLVRESLNLEIEEQFLAMLK
eukprot:CAMPEP_0179009640 /NCGR_PEP_ID=MMETSP0795-20121207/16380_1 /TAXON_ID=88552 /ORGANISM="Amoebophrya sp., Strain Ameob2" /LENGTH=1633 /DNA_ID=CAMNT_0020704851 /DNA_START=93 /DNA_END=4994 /DNA_ORIENTATION=+